MIVIIITHFLAQNLPSAGTQSVMECAGELVMDLWVLWPQPKISITLIIICLVYMDFLVLSQNKNEIRYVSEINSN